MILGILLVPCIFSEVLPEIIVKLHKFYQKEYISFHLISYHVQLEPMSGIHTIADL